MDDEQVRGGLGYLSTRSPAVRRLALEMTDRHADAIAAVLVRTPDGSDLPVAKVHAIALAWVFQTITDEAGRGIASGRTPQADRRRACTDDNYHPRRPRSVVGDFHLARQSRVGSRVPVRPPRVALRR
jgi:hypothetical protein